ncbi:MAG TPA: hypothetical protein VKZ41_03980 [Gemmatimonadales bacterium]|nr:hypothetical protein [Gemmatimonadales bacterium]
MRDSVNHLPSAEFRDYLEDEVVRAFRRDRRSGSLRALGVVLLSIALGSSAGIAAAQIRDGARRDSLLQAAMAELSLSALRLDLARTVAADISSKVAIGLLSHVVASDAEADLRAAEAEAMHAKANVDEIRASSQPPRNELNAPLVDGRDFVLERIRYDLLGAQQRLTAAERALDEMTRRVRIGADSEMARLAIEHEATRARAALGVLAERQRLRLEWVEKQTPVEQLVRRLRQSELRFDAMVADKALELARQRLVLARQLHAVGQVEQIEVLKAELEVREREIELQQIARQLQQVERSGGSGSPD